MTVQIVNIEDIDVLNLIPKKLMTIQNLKSKKLMAIQI